MRLACAAAAVGCALALAPPRSTARQSVDVLTATGALPAHMTGQFREPIGYAEATTGEAVVLDRRAHTIYLVNRTRTAVRKLVEVGAESGRVLQPAVLAVSTDDLIAVADAPGGLERIQYFNLAGVLIGGFSLQTRAAPRLTEGSRVLTGAGAMTFTGRTFLVSRPESGALFQEIDNRGAVIQQIGTWRRTGQEADADVHVAMNAGLPIADGSGGYYFVFLAGVPAFRKYDRDGRLVFERHVEGPHLDAALQAMPTTWPRRDGPEGRGLPIVPPLVRTAAVDSSGRLWISLAEPYTYVYDRTGEKVRTVQFTAAGVLAPASLSFTRDGRVLVTPGCYEFTVR